MAIQIFDFSKPAYPAVPLAITATLVTEAELPAPPPVEETEPEVPVETPEQVRMREEEVKRQADERASDRRS